MWEAPDWLARPAHTYTEKDWDYIRGIWAAERRRGADALYWQDVKVGERPAATLDGPVEVSVSPIPPWGMGAGGSRTLRREILDPALRATLVRGEKDGILRTRDRKDQVPQTPELPSTPGAPPPPNGQIQTTDIHKEGVERSPLVNYVGRDLAIRHLQNWMGDRAELRNIRWSIMDPRGAAKWGKPAPANPRAEHFLDRVPSMKGRFVDTHGLTQDVALVRSEVVSKYVRDGEFLVDLVWWIEALDGSVWEEGAATVKLPPRDSGVAK
jgi:hypothetical protein